MTPFLLAFLPPLTTLLFLVSRPHSPVILFPLAGLLTLLVMLDRVTMRDHRGHRSGFDALVLALAAIQFADIFVLVSNRSTLFDTTLSVLLAGTSTGYSVIVAHELIHRRNRALRTIGRAVLWTALYDHFFVEHLRGHHARAGTEDDASTARFDESFWRYALRNIPGELVSAYKIDARRVVIGIGVQATLMLAIGMFLGTRAVMLFVAQVGVAWILITAVNYLQHWGLERIGRRVTSAVAWDCESRLTHYMLLGLSRHADHHLHPTRSFAALGSIEGSPKLPHGYLRMILLILLFNRRAKALLTRAIRSQAPSMVELDSDPMRPVAP